MKHLSLSLMYLTFTFRPHGVRPLGGCPSPRQNLHRHRCIATFQTLTHLFFITILPLALPPKPEANIDAITKLRRKYLEKSIQIELCLEKSIQVGHSIHTGNYDQGFLYQPPSTTPCIFYFLQVNHLMRH
ncbi:hypothetical protein Hanom_Chr09g00865201 [Helianthus anomalus]